MKRIRLIEMFGPTACREVVIARPRVVIGRAPDCHYRPTGGSIAWQHAKLILDGKRLMVRDLGSKYGTYVNGQRIKGARKLKHGDVLTLGLLHFFIALPRGKRKDAPEVSRQVYRVKQTSKTSPPNAAVRKRSSRPSSTPE